MITSAGSVKITPAEIDAPADAPVCTILFSRMCPPPNRRSTAIDTTAAGIAVAIVRPANNPRYVFAAARIIASTIERTIARADSCGAVRVVVLVFMWLPTAGLALILFLEPRLQRREVVED